MAQLRAARNGAVLPGGRGHLDASRSIEPLDVPAGTVDRAMGDVHPFGNPHYLLDPMNGLRVAGAIRDALEALRPDARVGFTERYEAFRLRLARAMLGDRLGVKYPIEDFYDEVLESRQHPIEGWNGGRYPSLRRAEDAANMILHFAPETNGELAYRAYQFIEKKVGRPLADLAEKSRHTRATYRDLQAQPHRLLNSPIWSGLTHDGRAYSAFTYNYERLVPWRTLTGRQQFYQDHEGYIAFGENLPTYKPSPKPAAYGDLKNLAEGTA